MELDGPHLSFSIFDGCNGVRSLGGEAESGGKFFSFVAVGHPDGEKVRKSEEELGVGFLDLDFGVSVLALGCGTNFAAEGVNHVLQSVADAEHGNSEIEDALVGMRSVVVVDGARASGENDADGRVAANLF
jgi:hypothetical protein